MANDLPLPEGVTFEPTEDGGRYVFAREKRDWNNYQFTMPLFGFLFFGVFLVIVAVSDRHVIPDLIRNPNLGYWSMVLLVLIFGFRCLPAFIELLWNPYLVIEIEKSGIARVNKGTGWTKRRLISFDELRAVCVEPTHPTLDGVDTHKIPEDVQKQMLRHRRVFIELISDKEFDLVFGPTELIDLFIDHFQHSARKMGHTLPLQLDTKPA